MKLHAPRLAVPVLLLLASACATLKISTDYDTTIDFSRYRTFTLKHGTAANNPIVVDRLDRALAAAISTMGLSRVPEDGDLSIVSHFNTGKETQINTSTFGYRGWSGWRWGGYGMGAQSVTSVQEIPTGTVVVDAVDTKSGKAVWRGIAKDRISTSGTPEDYEKQAQEAARQLFANFPRTRKASPVN